MKSAKFIEKEHLGSNIYSFRFTKPFEGLKFVAGEFIEMKIPHDNPDDRGEKRWFTVSNVYEDDFIQITTRYFEDKASSFKKALFKLKEGDQIKISDPMGDFVLPKNKNQKLLFVAGGIGITPYMAMLKYMSLETDKRNAKLIWKLNSIKDRFTIPSKPDFIEEIVVVDKDKFNPKYLFEEFKKTESDRIYIAGPEPMVEALNNGLIELGLDKRVINTDFFPGYTA